MTDYNLDELEQLTGLARRTIRYYIQKGLVEAPFGARKTPRYTARHVEQLLQVRKYKEAGLNLARIAALLGKDEEGSASSDDMDIGDVRVITRMQIASGITLDIDPRKNQLSDEAVRGLASIIGDYLNQQQGNQDEH
ncbi:MerR family transcriptional regulator [Aliiglaciecola sp. CAU 1673]|uniref:MerR family transcriptional regulator n=1 Tax=Aliiglaciecola sp. CAU 1673 TaxID=3032595 RepID=UPI0023DCDAE6|nr:MerR family transcriptional regulator [Aliiglaciecola sp. CAU 1673]MDF2177935.1 MerR family transcriptional regulator [Aliiglaciecola sp. CAU 1673]